MYSFFSLKPLPCSVFLMHCCPHPESGHLFSWEKKKEPKGERICRELFTSVVLKQRNYWHAGGWRSAYRGSKHYTGLTIITILTTYFHLQNKTLGEDARSNSGGCFLMLTTIFSSITNQLCLFHVPGQRLNCPYFCWSQMTKGSRSKT